MGGFGTGPGLKTPRARTYETIMKKWYPKLPAADGFVYNYYNAAWAFVRGLQTSNGQVGAALQRRCRSRTSSAYEVSDNGVVRLDVRRQAIQDQYPLQIVQNSRRVVGTAGRRLRAERRPVVRRPVQADEPAARTRPARVREEEAAVAGQDPRGRRNGIITNQVIK